METVTVKISCSAEMLFYLLVFLVKNKLSNLNDFNNSGLCKSTRVCFQQQQ